jgi:hypothetical protein
VGAQFGAFKAQIKAVENIATEEHFVAVSIARD